MSTAPDVIQSSENCRVCQSKRIFAHSCKRCNTYAAVLTVVNLSEAAEEGGHSILHKSPLQRQLRILITPSFNSFSSVHPGFKVFCVSEQSCLLYVYILPSVPLPVRMCLKHCTEKSSNHVKLDFRKISNLASLL